MTGIAKATLAPTLARMKINVNAAIGKDISATYNTVIAQLGAIQKALEKGGAELHSEAYIDTLEVRDDEEEGTAKASATIIVEQRIGSGKWKTVAEMLNGARTAQDNAEHEINLIIDVEEATRRADGLVAQAMRNARQRAEQAAEVEKLKVGRALKIQIDGTRTAQGGGGSESVQVEVRAMFALEAPQEAPRKSKAHEKRLRRWGGGGNQARAHDHHRDPMSTSGLAPDRTSMSDPRARVAKATALSRTESNTHDE